MDNPINQMYLFLVYLICGSIIGIFFDIFRILMTFILKLCFPCG